MSQVCALYGSSAVSKRRCDDVVGQSPIARRASALAKGQGSSQVSGQFSSLFSVLKVEHRLRFVRDKTSRLSLRWRTCPAMAMIGGTVGAIHILTSLEVDTCQHEIPAAQRSH